MKPTFQFSRLAAALAVSLCGAAAARAQGTAFTYQGRLQENGAGVTGVYDLRFNLYGAAEGGGPVTGSYTVNGHPVSNGLFAVTLDFGNQFPGANRWLEIGAKTNGAASFATLSPRQYLAATPYAITSGNLSGNVAATQITGVMGGTNLSGNYPRAVSFTNSGNSFGGSGAGLTSLPAGQLTGTVADARLSANVALRAGGNSFNGNQSISGGNLLMTDPLSTILFPEFTGSSIPMLTMFSGGGNSSDRSVIGHSLAYPDWGLQYQDAQDRFNFVRFGVPVLSVGLNSMSVGINTLASTTAALEINGNTLSSGSLTFSNPNRTIQFPEFTGTSSPMLTMFTGGGFNSDRMVIGHSPAYPDWGLQYQDSVDQFHFVGSGIPVLTVGLGNGSVGINKASAHHPLEIGGLLMTVDGLGAERAYLGADGIGGDVEVGSLNAAIGTVSLYNRTANQQMNLAARDINYSGTQNQLNVADNFASYIRSADLFIGHSSRRGAPGRALVDFADTLHLNFASDWANTVIGGANVSVCTLTIRGGCDIAEPFQMSHKEIPKGSVVVIDETNPGHLKISGQAHDRRVAGIISGANGVNTGVQLTQEGVFENGQNVALSGRVYVHADTGNGAIKPGDLLTTSDVPGHAMKVTDHAKAQGAILGKAMTALEKGKGYVLVLVTLQ